MTWNYSYSKQWIFICNLGLVQRHPLSTNLPNMIIDPLKDLHVDFGVFFCQGPKIDCLRFLNFFSVFHSWSPRPNLYYGVSQSSAPKKKSLFTRTSFIKNELYDIRHVLLKYIIFLKNTSQYLNTSMTVWWSKLTILEDPFLKRLITQKKLLFSAGLP